MSNGTIGVKTCGLRLRQIVVMVQWDARNNDRVQRTPDSPQRMSCQCYGFQMMIIKKLPTYFLIFLLFFIELVMVTVSRKNARVIWR